jgi:hypothetical protein
MVERRKAEGRKMKAELRRKNSGARRQQSEDGG